MKLHSIRAFLVGCVVLVTSAVGDDAKLSKAQELDQAREFVSRLGATTGSSRLPVVGVLNHWELRIDTYSEDHAQQLKRAAMYPLYDECCRAMGRLYGAKPTTYLAEDSMGYPSQMTVVEFDDADLGKSHLIAGVSEGNDSTGFYFLHLPGAFEVKKEWKRRDTWDLEGIFIDAEKPTEQGGAGQPSTHSEADLEGGDKPQPESEGRSR